MSELITELTPAQQADIEPTIRRWRDSYTVTTDRQKQAQLVTTLYKRFITKDSKSPMIVHTSSPIVAIVLSKIWKPFWADFIPKLDKLGINIEGDSLGDSLDASLGASLDASLRDSLGASLDASLRDSLGASLDASLGASLDASLDAEYNSILWGYWRWHGWWRSGVSIVDFLLRNFPDDKRLKWNKEDAILWRDCGKYIGLLLIYSENVCFVIDNPTRSVFNTSGVLDYDHGKAVEYSDGWGFYILKGVRFQEEQYWKIVNQELTGEDIAKLASDNIFTSDQSEIAISMLGADNLLREMGAKLIATGTKYSRWLQTSEDYDFIHHEPTKLYRVENFRGTGKTEYCIVMEHPSIKGKKYLEWVEPSVGEKKDADLAQAVAFGITKQEYINSIEA